VPLEIRTLSDRVHEILRDRIVSHDIEPGEAIRQDVIAAELGISKIPLREALSRLEESRLVRSVPNRGYIAAPLSSQEVDEVFALRLLVEPPTAALAAKKPSPEARARLQRAMTDLTEAGEGLKVTASARLALLLAMIRPLERPTTILLVAQLFFRSERYIHQSIEDGEVDLSGVRLLMEAWLAGHSKDVEIEYRARLKARWSEARRALGEEPAHRL
jgi:DNA-binding GntR family transcriptional regulator